MHDLSGWRRAQVVVDVRVGAARHRAKLNGPGDSPEPDERCRGLPGTVGVPVTPRDRGAHSAPPSASAGRGPGLGPQPGHQCRTVPALRHRESAGHAVVRRAHSRRPRVRRSAAESSDASVAVVRRSHRPGRIVKTSIPAGRLNRTVCRLQRAPGAALPPLGRELDHRRRSRPGSVRGAELARTPSPRTAEAARARSSLWASVAGPASRTDAEVIR